MLEFWHRHCRSCIAAALVPASLLGGCTTQLAVHDPYFSPFAEVGRDNAADAQQTMAVGQSVRALQAACVPAGPGADALDGAELDVAGGRKALRDLCAAWRGRPPESHGGIQNAYQRWSKDQLRRMRSPKESAATAAGS